jgi:hypothetical protein
VNEGSRRNPVYLPQIAAWLSQLVKKPKLDRLRSVELNIDVSRCSSMCDGADKLRQLAMQSRILSRQASDRRRSSTLAGLARLYEEQALQLECRTDDQSTSNDVKSQAIRMR